MEMTFDEKVTDNKFKTGGKGWTAELKKGEHAIFGEATNYPSFVKGKVGKAIYFSNGSHLALTTTPLRSMGSELSISVWVNPDSTRPGITLSLITIGIHGNSSCKSKTSPFSPSIPTKMAG